MVEETKSNENKEIPLKIRLDCSGWYDKSTGKVHFRGQIFEGKAITPRMQKAFDTQETFVDPVTRVKKLVFEEVPEIPAPRTRPIPPKVNLKVALGPEGQAKGKSE